MSNRFSDCISQLLIDKKISPTTVMVIRVQDSQKEKVQGSKFEPYDAYCFSSLIKERTRNIYYLEKIHAS
jgi:hypothetical protein